MKKRNSMSSSVSLSAGKLPMIKNNLALSIAVSMLLPMGSIAQEAKDQSKEQENTTKEQPAVKKLDTVKIEAIALEANPNAQEGVPYKAQFSGDDRHTRPLAEIPQNISVITKASIEESGYTDLRQILDAQPGITIGTGENGNAFGDRYIIRGQEARSDVFVDGLRDPGMTTRESFAIEQIEITKGPNSSFAGRGTSGGAVNAITKQATTDYDYTSLTAGAGTDSHTRIVLDSNQALNDELAIRANFLYGKEDVPDRAPADRERKGVAISGLYIPTDELEIVLDYYGLDARDTPDMGSYLTGTAPNRKPAKDVPVYAQKQDFLESDVDTVTARVKYFFNSDVRLTNITRKGTADNGYVVTGARGTFTGVNNPGGVYATATLSSHHGWQEVDYFANQTNLFINKEIAGLNHEFILSAEYTDHSVLNGVYNLTSSGQNCITGTGSTLNSWCISGVDGKTVAGLNNIMNRKIAKGNWDIDWAVKATSISAMDTVDLNDSWTVFAGVRSDRFDFDMGTQNTNTLAKNQYDYSDSLINGHVGITYDINEEANVYLSFASASDINGGESDVGTSSGYGGVVIHNGNVAGADPESSKNIELGTKWNIFDEELLLTAAIFQITKSDVMEGANYDSVGTFNTGENRVRGIEFGATGEITDKLAVQAGATFMDAEVLESATANNVGKTLSNFADTTASIQLKYQFTEKFGLGAAAKYESDRYAGQPDTAAAFDAEGRYSQPIPAYTVFDVFATYDITEKLDARLNIGNISNKDYYLAAYRSGSFLYKGDARTVRLTLNYNF